MENYLIEIKDGHHHVRIFTDREMNAVNNMIEVMIDVFERIRTTVRKTLEIIVDFIEQLPEESKEALLNENTTDKTGH